MLFLVNLCQYDNQTYGINQSIITTNCEMKCACIFSNGTTISTCKRLCHGGEDPRCNQSSQMIKEYYAPVNGSNCTCAKRICISGMIDITNSIHLNELCYPLKFLKRKVLIEKNLQTWQHIVQFMTFASKFRTKDFCILSNNKQNIHPYKKVKS